MDVDGEPDQTKDDNEIAARATAENVNEGDLVWAEQKETFHFCKVLKVNDDDTFLLQSLITQRVIYFTS